jgi:hypothetical protein
MRKSLLRRHRIAGRDIAERLAFADDVGEKFEIASYIQQTKQKRGRSCLD